MVALLTDQDVDQNAAVQDLHIKGEYQGNALITKRETTSTSTTSSGWGATTTLSSMAQSPEVTRGLLAAARIYFYGKQATVNGTDVQALEVFNHTRQGLSFGPTIAEMLQSISSSTSSTFGQAASENQSGQEIEARPRLNIGVLHTEASKTTFTNTDWIKRPEIRGEFEEKMRVLHKWQTSTSSASGLYDPNVSAVVSLAVSIGIGYMTAGTGSLFTSFAKMGMTKGLGILGTQMAAAGARAALVGITSQAVMGLARGQTPDEVAQELSSSKSVQSLAISMLAASALHGVNDALKIKAAPTELGDQIKKQVVKAGVEGVAGLARGQELADVIRGAAIGMGAGVVANQIGGAYKGEEASLDYVSHKLCHGVLGGIMGSLIADDAKRGAVSGAIGAVAAEIMAETISTHLNDVGQQAYNEAETTGELLADEDYEKRLLEQAYTQGEIAKLGAALVTLLATQDVEVSIKTATNAIENNWISSAARMAAKSVKYVVEMAKKGRHAYQMHRFVNRNWHKELGISKEWQKLPSDKHIGVKYQSPVKGNYNEVRIMKARPESNLPAQRVDYVKVMRNGQYRDIKGNIVKRGDPESHIPLKGNEKIIEGLIQQVWK